MRVVVTGANGLVGSRLSRLLSQQRHEVTFFARGAQRPALDAKGTYVNVELSDSAALSKALADSKPELIINCAAMTDVDGCERDPSGAWAANVEAVATLAKFRDAFLLHVSTDYVFDGDAGPYDVDAIPNPRGIYAVTKHAGEEAVRALGVKDRWAIGRTAVVYGWPSTGKNNFGSWLVGAFNSKTPVKLFSDQWVSPSHATNVAAMLAEIGTRQLGGIWHTSGSDVVDRVTFGKKLCERFGFDASLITPSRMSDVNLPSPRPAKSGLIVKKTAQALHEKPWSLEAALDRLFAEFKGAS